jgi:hypothetical protein
MFQKTIISTYPKAQNNKLLLIIVGRLQKIAAIVNTDIVISLSVTHP